MNAHWTERGKIEEMSNPTPQEVPRRTIMTWPPPAGAVGWLLALVALLLVIVLTVIGHLPMLLAILIGLCAASRLI